MLEEAVAKSESLWLFDRLKSATKALVADGSTAVSLENPIKHCLQSKLDPVFTEIIGGGNKEELEWDLGLTGSPRSVGMEIKNQSMELPKGRKGSLIPLRLLKNKKILQTEVKNEGTFKDWIEKKTNSGGCILSKGLRNGLIHDHHRQKAKQIWKKHVWVVLLFDVCICVVLFGIWLWVYQGFQCIEG